MPKYALIAMTVVVAGCPSSTPMANKFRLGVAPASVVDVNHREATLSFQTPSNAEVVVEVDGDRSVISLNELNSGGTFNVKMNVTRGPSDIDGKSTFTTLIRPQAANGAYAGGPSTYTRDSDLELTEVLLVTAVPGEYQLGTPLNVGTENGMPIWLTVTSIASENGSTN